MLARWGRYGDDGGAMGRVESNTLPDEVATEPQSCFHCGLPCVERLVEKDGKSFCCDGCRLVHDILLESGMGQFYDLNQHPGIRPVDGSAREQWAYLDEPEVRAKLLDFTDGRSSRVTFQVPSIHCVACVWLLENLFRLHPAIGDSRVNFARREVSIRYASERLELSELVALLASIGYEPRLTLEELERPRARQSFDRQKLQIGIAGFAFANIMLFSIPVYLGLDALSAPWLERLFGYLSLGLALPVLIYSAADYWKSARWSLQQRTLTLDLPIALGLAALFAQSTFEIVSGQGEGYLDSLVGLVFFLLCGRWFQQMTHDRLTFDRDYRSFFPLAVLRRSASGDAPTPLAQLEVGDRLLLRQGELIPADARLVHGAARIDYSFVTGESELVTKAEGELLYAGGRHVGGLIEVEVLKPVSQSYLTSLWDHAAFRKRRDDPLNTLTQRYGRRFTRLVITIACGSALYWTLTTGLGRGVTVLVAVLIVACPCALRVGGPVRVRHRPTLAGAPRHLRPQRDGARTPGTGRRGGARQNGHLDGRDLGGHRVRRGTAHDLGTRRGGLPGPGLHPSALAPNPCRTRRPGISGNTESHEAAAGTVKKNVGDSRELVPPDQRRLTDFEEFAGGGLRGCVDGRSLRLGSVAWLRSEGAIVPDDPGESGGSVGLVIDGAFRGTFRLANALRPAVGQLIRALGRRYTLALLSGDQPREYDSFRKLFGPDAELLFKQSPLEKLEYVRRLQTAGKTVLMVGDGLNDAGAFQQSDVGVAVVESIGAFSPASDVILDADEVPALADLPRFARRTIWVVRLSLGLSALYNVVGISIAAAGLLSPLICAILMPLSSITVVLFATAATSLAFRRFGLTRAA